MRISRVVVALAVATAGVGLTGCDNGQHPSTNPGLSQTATVSAPAGAAPSGAPSAGTSAAAGG